MLTVLESINLSTDYLKNKGIESPRINAELILAHILKCKRLQLYLSFDRPLKEEEVILYRELLKRRSKFEPLQYIIGNVNFLGLDFKVTPSVLIPRPETELLVEEIIAQCRDKEFIKILDIGTGSGNIAITLAKFIHGSNVIATDISEEAIEVAKKNAAVNEVEGKVFFLKHNILLAEKLPEEDFDIIVSNPPYVTLEEFKNLDNELKDYEPSIALTDSSDGLSFYKIITAKSKNYLKENGKIYFELGHNLSTKVFDILQANNFSNISIKKDYQNIERIISGELL